MSEMGEKTLGGQGVGQEIEQMDEVFDGLVKGGHSREDSWWWFYKGWTNKQEYLEGVGQGMKLPGMTDWLDAIEEEISNISQESQEGSVSPLTAYRLGWKACLLKIEEMNQGGQEGEEKIKPQKPYASDGAFPFATVWDKGGEAVFLSLGSYQSNLDVWKKLVCTSKHFWGWMWNPVVKDWILIQEEHKAEEVKPVVLDESKLFGGQVYATVWSGGKNPPSQGYDTVEKLHEDIQLFHSYKHNDHNRISIFVKVGEKWLLVEEQVKDEGK